MEVRAEGFIPILFQHYLTESIFLDFHLLSCSTCLFLASILRHRGADRYYPPGSCLTPGGSGGEGESNQPGLVTLFQPFHSSGTIQYKDKGHRPPRYTRCMGLLETLARTLTEEIFGPENAFKMNRCCVFVLG